MLSSCCVCRDRNLRTPLGEPFFLLELNSLPRRIAEDAVEAALVEYLGEGEVPVEEAVLLRELGDFGF